MKTLREQYGAEIKFTQSLANDLDSLNKINSLLGLPRVVKAVNEMSIPGGSIDVVGYTVKGEVIVYEHQDLSGRADQTHVAKTSHYALVLKNKGLKVLGAILLCESIDQIFLDNFENIRWAYNKRPTQKGECNVHAIRSQWTDDGVYDPVLFTDDSIVKGSDTVLNYYKDFVSIYGAEWSIQREESNGNAITLWHRLGELDNRYMAYIHKLKGSINVGLHCLKAVTIADEEFMQSLETKNFTYRKSKDRATIECKFPTDVDYELLADTTEQLKRAVRQSKLTLN
tara:strand:+ start:56 stop:907 length:852 start_codon:yes stop_codon:yes gene_type:complete